MTPRELFLTDIVSSSELNELLPKIFKTQGFEILPFVNFNEQGDIPPIFIYQESRDEKKFVSTFEYYGGRAATSTQLHLGQRGILDLNSKSISETERGKILNAYCRIDFCIDVFVCIDLGVFSNKTSYSSVQSLFEENGPFSTSDKKMKYLRAKKQIRNKTYKAFGKARRIRNTLAHQYMPTGNLGLDSNDLAQHSSLVSAIEHTYNLAWIYLIQDFNDKQIEIAKWIYTNSSQ